jgi:hypothetical protein
VDHQGGNRLVERSTERLKAAGHPEQQPSGAEWNELGEHIREANDLGGPLGEHEDERAKR